MATLTENRVNVAIQTAQVEAEKHNRKISERFEQLMNAENSQLTESFSAGKTFVAPIAVAPVQEEPVQNEVYSHVPVTSSLFTTETLERTLSFNREQTSQTVVSAPVAVESVKVQAKEDTYAFSALAKAVAVIFAVLVITMLSIIAVNSKAIQLKRVKIRSLEEKRQELMEESQSLQERLAEVRSIEYIKEWAEKNGYTFE